MGAKNSIFLSGREYLYSKEGKTILLLQEGDNEFTYAKYEGDTLNLLEATTCVNGSCFPRDKECLGDDFSVVAGIVVDIL